jgi:c-di-GMP-binding flagellar brake protein YcgR
VDYAHTDDALRNSLRVARALQVDLDWAVGGTRAMTIDLSAGGIAVLLDKAPPQGEELKYTLRLGGGVTVAGQARVVNVRLQPNNVRVALAFQNISEADREKLEVEVFDTVLGQLKS